ncbi:MAG TPA: NAD-dependent epimerase/dehydratase family protein [Phycisphaerales bacterium]|nr:NAD-dependent epimerase/dehydratase family protein [Phycisphaerales bacterium]
MTTRPDKFAPTTGPQRGRSRALVTGGAGFIGSHLVEWLLCRGDDVVVVDDLSTGRARNLSPHDRLEIIESRASAAAARFDAEGREFDEIYHLAAAVGVQLVMDSPIEAIETNILETIALLRYAASSPRRPTTLVASSSEVYGKGARSPFAEEDDVVYGPTTIARWSYGMSKAIDEHLALAHHRRTGLPVVVARFFNTVGPRQIGRYGMVLPRFVAAALANEPIVVHGTGAQTRCFCDVRDVVEALPRMLAEPACRGRVFNLGSDREITILELARTVVATLSSRSPIHMLPYEEAFPEGFEDLPRRRPTLDRVREAIGFTPRRSLEQTIRDVAAAMHAEQPGRVRA